MYPILKYSRYDKDIVVIWGVQIRNDLLKTSRLVNMVFNILK
jgi:hypothetical protein